MALLALLAIAVMTFAYVLTSRLNAASRFVGIDRDHNAQVLGQAKRALIGTMALQAASAGENNPGRLPCPEAPGDFNTVNEGRAAGNCTLPAVGRLPWRTLGLEKLVDAAGEPLWYVVSPGWALSNSTTPPLQTLINSDSPGQLALDGVANDAVALIIAPGPAITVQAGGPCTGWAQTRPVAAPPDLRNYLECGNTAANFVTSASGSTFNDQVLRVAAADVIPALEAAIADRMQREIAPVLRTVYTSSEYSGIPSSSPMYPYAAPFANPGTSTYQGEVGTYQGLLPFNQTQGCINPDPRCTTTLVAWASPSPSPPPTAIKVGGVGKIMSMTCSWQSGGTVAECAGDYEEVNSDLTAPGPLMQMTATINNVARGVRKLDWSKAVVQARKTTTDPWELQPLEPAPATLATMNANGSVTIQFTGRLPNVDAAFGVAAHKVKYSISLELAVMGDHFLLDPATTGPGAATSWFVRNQWYRTTYYATVRRNTAVSLSTLGCIDSSDTTQGCLRFNDSSIYNIRALLVFTGRSLSNPAGRPNNDLRDYVEWQNCDHNPDSTNALDPCVPRTKFEQRPMRGSKVFLYALNAPFNDRVVLVDWNGSLNSTQVVSTSPLRTFALP